jgi:uncharacterized membrane protein YidH (DUF202 family)
MAKSEQDCLSMKYGIAFLICISILILILIFLQFQKGEKTIDKTVSKSETSKSDKKLKSKKI